MRPVVAQVIPKSLQQGAAEKDIRETKNAWTVGIVGGLASGTYMRFAVDLARALDDRDNLRVLNGKACATGVASALATVRDNRE